MLRITRKAEYALIALRHIYITGDQAVCNAREIAIRYNLPYNLLAKVLQELARKGILEPVQGPHGGYRLKADLHRISLTDFFEFLEGPLGIMDCYFDYSCELVDSCNIRTPIRRINDTMRKMFNNITVYDVTH